MKIRSGLSAATAIAVGLGTVPLVAPAAQAADSGVVINEVESNGDPNGDWVELANTDPSQDIDISGWSVIDNDDKHSPIVFPEGTTIESGGYKSFRTDGDGGFGLGSDDSVTLRDASGKKVDTTSWTQHAKQTWGRVPDMTGEFTDTAKPTRDLANVGTDEAGDTGDNTGGKDSAFPYPTDGAGDFTVTGPGAEAFSGEDMSGVDFDDKGNAYVVNNDNGELFILENAGNKTWNIRGHFTLKYPDGSGKLDTEGVTVREPGKIAVATERDNSEKKVSRPSVVEYTLPAQLSTDGSELKADREINLEEFTGKLDPNGGLEAIEWLPEVMGGVYAVGVESTGEILFVQTENGTVKLKDRYKSPFTGVMALDYDQHNRSLLALCDDACDGRSISLNFEDGGIDGTSTKVVPGEIHARPSQFENFANEGFGRYHGKNGGDVLMFADDGAANGVSLRGVVGDGAHAASSLPGSNLGSGSGSGSFSSSALGSSARGK